jgi:hypothetical protein
MLTPHGAARPELVCVEGRSGMCYFDRDDQADALAVHARAFGHLASRALPPDESVDWIRAAAAQCS